MKKIAVCVLSLIIILSGCSSNIKNKGVASSGYICDANISYGEALFIKSKLWVPGGGIFKMEITSPETLADFKIEFLEEEAKVSYKNMTLPSFPGDDYGSVVHLINGAFLKLTAGKSATKGNSGQWVYEDVYKTADFIFKLNEEGFPTELSFSQIDLKAEFSNWIYRKNS